MKWNSIQLLYVQIKILILTKRYPVTIFLWLLQKKPSEKIIVKWSHHLWINSFKMKEILPWYHLLNNYLLIFFSMYWFTVKNLKTMIGFLTLPLNTEFFFPWICGFFQKSMKYKYQCSPCLLIFNGRLSRYVSGSVIYIIYSIYFSHSKLTYISYRMFDPSDMLFDSNG